MASIVHRIFDRAFNHGDFTAVDELMAQDSITRTPIGGGSNNRMGFIQLIAGLRAAFPDLHCTIDDEVADGNKVAAPWTMRGTHQGAYLGSPPTGRPVVAHGMFFARVANGMIVENWILVDQFSILQQLGIVPPPRSKPARGDLR